MGYEAQPKFFFGVKLPDHRSAWTKNRGDEIYDLDLEDNTVDIGGYYGDGGDRFLCPRIWCEGWDKKIEEVDLPSPEQIEEWNKWLGEKLIEIGLPSQKGKFYVGLYESY